MSERARVRAELVDLCSALLLGPLAEDELLPAAPADTYLTGILWPRGTEIGVEEDDAAAAGPEDKDSGAGEALPGYRAVRPCSIGITFSADTGATITVELGSTARYRPVEKNVANTPAAEDDAAVVPAQEAGSEIVPVVEADADEPAGVSTDSRFWQREPLGYRMKIPFEPENRSWSSSDWKRPSGEEHHDASVTLHIRRRIVGEQQIVTVTLINSAPEPEPGTPRDHSSLFQTEIVVTASKGSETACIRPRPAVEAAGQDEDAETSALLYRDVREFAVGHGVAAMWPTPTDDAVESVRTDWLPQVSVKDTSAEGHQLLGRFLEGSPDTLRAGWLSREGARDEILRALEGFAGCYDQWIDTELEARLDEVSAHRNAAERNLKRCRTTLERIRRGIRVLADNDAAWRAFCLANAAMDRQSQFPAKGERARPLVWRPFQLAYQLMVMPGLVDPVKFSDDRRIMDLLWFPTGGGKTEAYLGLAAFVIFFRRLSDPRHAASGGVDVLMRYTLRLLTVQQFQRAAALVTSCELIRLAADELGSARISIGLYVGGEASPNRMDDAVKAVREEHDGLKPRSTPRQLLACPVCGTDLPPASYSMSDEGNAVEIRCGNRQCETYGSPLPVLTVDDQIYAEPPSLLIGTIDKFAQLPRREDIRRLFGLDGRRRPELVVQDELHLISGPLGSMSGLYETAIDLLCTDDGVGPKIIGSTATIGQAARQVRALFDREVAQFPPAGFNAADSFFAVRDSNRPDRVYLGVCSAGRSPKFALQAVAASVLEVVEALRRRDGADERLIDAFWTLVLYFNSLRELGGAYSLMQDDVPRQIGFLSSRLDGARRALEHEPIELSSRVSSRELPEKLVQLEVGLSGDRDDPFAASPQDSVLASNMISVGVDISRLGLMIVNGQPKSTAEYIQATSRVGRGIEGLVITLYNFGRPRDLSHFEHFVGYHSALYRSVEATSVTPWAPRARDKALHAMFASVIRHLVAGMSADDAAIRFNPANPDVQRAVEFILARVDSTTASIELDDTREDLEALIEQWARRSRSGQVSGGRLNYWEKKAPFGKTAPHLMYAAEEGDRNSMLAWATPNSMREVEPSTAFTLKRIGNN